MSPVTTLVLLDANVFYPIVCAKRTDREHPVYSKICNQRHRPIKNTWLLKHYLGMISGREGEPALRYIDRFYDQAQSDGIPLKIVSEGERRNQSLTRRTRPSHSKDTQLIKIAKAAKRRNNSVLIISDNGHVHILDPNLHTDLGIRAIRADRYVEEFC